MILVGLTGGICSGKSEALRIFKSLGAKTLDADHIVKKMYAKGSLEYKKMIRAFGKAIVDKRGNINKTIVRRMVLESPSILKKLEMIMHPGVRRAIQDLKTKWKKRKKVIVIEVPLLFETGLYRKMDRTVAVIANHKSLQNYARKRRMSADLLDELSKRQWPVMKKARKADYVVRNNLGLKELRQKVKRIYEHLKEK